MIVSLKHQTRAFHGALTAASCLLFSVTVWAHPHALVETELTFVFDRNGLAEIQSVWRHDSTTSMDLFSLNDKNEDGSLDDAETARMVSALSAKLEEDQYFTHLRVDAQPHSVTVAPNVSAVEDRQRIRFFFAIPCALAAENACREVRISQYDRSYYTAFVFSDPAYRVVNAEPFEWDVEIRKNTEESYYGGMVHPEELVLHFWKRGTNPDGRNANGLQKPAREKGDDIEDGNAASQARPSSLGSLRSDLFAWLVRSQQALHQRIEGLVADNGGTLGSSVIVILCLIAFLYGVLHAAGPGHGKFITSAYLIGSKSTMAQGILLGCALALCHGASGTAVVLLGRFILVQTTDAVMGSVDVPLKIVSFSMIAAMGIGLLFLEVTHRGCSHAHCGSADTHQHCVPSANARRAVLVALAAGIVPCPGVIILTLFCSGTGHAALGVLLAGCVSTGMALTLSAVAVVTVSARRVLVNSALLSQQRLLRAERVSRLFGSGLLATAGTILVILEALRS